MITINYNKFRSRFNEFRDLTDEDIELYYNESRTLISPTENIEVLPNNLRESGVYLATALIAKEYKNMATEDSNNTSNGGGIISSASEGSVSLSYQSIPYKSIKEYDLLANDIQPYGKMLLRIINLSQPKIVTNTNINNINYYNVIR